MREATMPWPDKEGRTERESLEAQQGSLACPLSLRRPGFRKRGRG